MNRFVFGRGWVFCDETTGGDGNGNAGGAAGAGADGSGAAGDAAAGGGADGDGAAGGEAAQPDGAAAAAKGDGKEGEPKDMLDAITKGLEKTAPKKEDAPLDEEAKKAADAAKAAAEKHANGAPKKDAKGNELDDAGKIVKPAEAPKPKSATELDLKPEERKALGAKAQARFTEVITTLKARETEIATLNEQIKPLAEARDGIVSILEETKTTSDQLSAYLEFNRMLQSENPKELEAALSMVEAQRAALYKALGKEGDGIDLLADFPDLQSDVEEARITRERALELAQGRREKAAGDARAKQQQRNQQTATQVQQARENALTDITGWTNGLSKSDLDYKAKEERLLEQVDEVIKNYPPDKWLSTLKLLYGGITVQKQVSQPNKGEQPLRPSGAKPGAKAPQNMYEAMWGSGKQ